MLPFKIRGSVSLRSLQGIPWTAGRQSADQVELSCLAACSTLQQFEPIQRFSAESLANSCTERCTAWLHLFPGKDERRATEETRLVFRWHWVVNNTLHDIAHFIVLRRNLLSVCLSVTRHWYLVTECTECLQKLTVTHLLWTSRLSCELARNRCWFLSWVSWIQSTHTL